VNLVYNFLTTRWPEAWPFVQGLLFVGVVLLFPKGIAGLLELIRFTRLATRNVEA
jgi:urea transport system permease protein